MKVYKVPLTFAEHHIDINILDQDIRWVFTGPLVLWFTIYLWHFLSLTDTKTRQDQLYQLDISNYDELLTYPGCVLFVREVTFENADLCESQ